jgi:hypothetical protein
VAERPLAEVVKLDAGATCLELDRLTLRIARWRERDSVDARIHVDVHGDPSLPNRITFTVTKEGGASAQRTLGDAPKDCDELHSAVALAIALSIDATLMDARAQKEADIPLPEPPPPEPPKPTLLQLDKPREPSANESKEPMHLDAGILVGPSVHVLRTTSFAFAPRVWFFPVPWFALSATGYVTYGSGQSIGTTPGRVATTLGAAGLEACFTGQPIRRFDLLVCGGARLGSMRNVGSGFTASFRDTDMYVGASAALQLRVWMEERIALAVSIEGLAPLRDYVMLVSGTGGSKDQSATLPGLGLNVALGPVFRFF